MVKLKALPVLFNMPANISQEQLDLCRLGMVIAQLQIHGLIATAKGLNLPVAPELENLQANMAELSKQIFNGEIKASA
jgi:hypothetical protein